MFLKTLFRAAPIVLLLGLANCGSLDRISNIGKQPEMTPINVAGGLQNQQKKERVAVPMPQSSKPQYQPNSLWQTGARAFFKDQRAAQIGDLLTVIINISDEANMANTTSRSRSAEESAGIDNFLGFENKFDKALPDGVQPGELVNGESDSSHTGRGTIDRQENIELTIAAIVTNVLPNGNLVIRGRQEVRVNFEVRELFIAGIVRPQDISNTNTIRHSQIAEARIAYGGRGQITDVQQPRYGQQFFDIVFPF